MNKKGENNGKKQKDIKNTIGYFAKEEKNDNECRIV